MAVPRLMILIFGAIALVVGAVASLALGTWWVLFAVLAVHFLATAVVVGYSWLRASESYDKPDPVTEARIEEEGGEPQTPRSPRVARDREVFN